MELTWSIKLRIAAAAVVGVVLVGVVSWPSQSTPDPFGSLLLQDMGIDGAVTLLVMAFFAGLIASFATWPYGREIGVLAVPFGLCLWAVRAGSTGALMQLSPTAEQREAILAALRWETAFWLLVTVCGYAGVLLGQKILSRIRKQKNPERIEYSPTKLIYVITALFLSAVIVIFCISLFARDVGVLDGRLSQVSAQPALGQIVFAVLLSFGIAAFAVKLFLNVSYIWPIASCAIVTTYAITTYMKQNVMEEFVQQWPAVFFPNAVISILPVQIVAFGTIGSIIGYWMAMRYSYWRRNEM